MSICQEITFSLFPAWLPVWVQVPAPLGRAFEARRDVHTEKGLAEPG